MSDRNDNDVVDDIVQHSRLASTGDDDRVESYLRSYFRHVDPADLDERRVEDLFGAAADHGRLALAWTPGTDTIVVRNPSVETDGWENQHTVVMLVVDDLPFLVDSVTMEITRQGHGIHLVVHPIMLDGRRADLGITDPGTHPDVDGGLVSLIYLEIDKQSGEHELEAVEAGLHRVLCDVRAAVEDWQPMRDQALRIADEIQGSDLPVAPADLAEGVEFLRWLADNHFTFLGYREYRLADVDGEESLCHVEGSGLGILRSPNGPTSRPLSDLPEAAQRQVHDPRLFNLTSADSRATVHRAAFLEYVGIKIFDAGGAVIGEHRFLGLYSSQVFIRSVTEIPIIRRLVAEVRDRSGYPVNGHDEKRLLAILESYPRTELFQLTTDELFDTAMGIARLQERHRVRVFSRYERFGRFVSCLVFLPRERYNTDTRHGIQELLTEAFGGEVIDWDARVTESVLARLYFTVACVNDGTEQVDTRDLEARIATLIRMWDDDLASEIVDAFGEGLGIDRLHRYGRAFPQAYKVAFDPRAAVADIDNMESLDTKLGIGLSVYREPGLFSSSFKMKLYRSGERISLTSIMPTLGNLGINVLDERPYEIEVDDGEPIWIYDFALEHGNPLPFDRMADLIEATFTTVWAGDVVDDGFNQLVLAAGIDCRDVAIFRAYARYLRQIGAPYSQLYLQQTLTTRAGITCLLLELFRARFDPDQGATDDMIEERRGSLSEAIDLVDVLDEDRILRRFANLIDATLRTTRYQLRDGRPNPYLAFKLEPTAIDEMPMPRPRYEIFVYSPRLEGVHLRAGAVARGGLRWSDRLEDYRTEVLGLAKAQMVKNAVIVPVGAKGGFILKQPPTDPALAREEAVAGYRLFVGALLDLTDNLVDGEVVPPDRTIRYDGDDPYLVVAADKGTATLSDVANEIATSRGFWLGDAFASGGSNGYDHKQMAITARGAWESVNRHFRELGIDVETTDFTAVGIGDMSGDVFGNGMLRSPHTRLVAAFDHRHVFVDPNPDAASSFQERSRLFALGRSSWADYDTELLSPGGAVFDRRAKSVELSPEIQAALDVDAANMTPDRLISAVLRAPVDLLWNGGIGTYVKASDESHAEVGDKSNDAIRVDAASLRCRVIGEGGNLGITQQGRIEFARAGGRIYTDAIDNAGGVDCSDHEVNLKILLDRVVADGELTVKQRNQLLDEMTAEVAQQVLAGNYAQTQALSTDRVESASLIDVHRRHIASLEARGLLDRRLEGLPDAEEVAERRSAGEGLTTPELAILLAYTKNILGDELLASAVPDDRAFERLLADYFPEPVRERFAPYVTSHPLRREIIANRITNRVVDRGGITMVYRLSKESSVRSVDIAAAHLAAWEIFDLEQLWSDVIDLDGQVAAGTQLSIFLAGRQLAERATRWLVRNRNLPLDATSAVADLAAKVRDTMINLSDWLLGADRRAFFRTVDELTRASVPIELAERTALLGHSIAALDIVSASDVTNAPISTVASVHFAVAELMDLTWIRDQILALPRDTEMETLARLGLRGDLYLDHKSLTELVTNSGDGWVDGDDLTAVERVEVWVGNHQEPVARYREAVTNIKATSLTDLTALLVASREVRTLIRRVGQNNSA